jgi:uncharacterized protein (TIGR03437 family)
MPPLNPVLALAGAGRLIRALAFVFLLAALAAAADVVWTQQQALIASDGARGTVSQAGLAGGDQFGTSVSVSGDTAVIGAYYKTISRNPQQGAAYVFVQSGTAWAQQQELTAPDGAAADYFGYAVSVSGDTVVIGAYLKTVNSQYAQGAAYVFVRSGAVWSLQQELTASDGGVSDWFGSSVSVSGDTVVIGAVQKNGARGAAYVFVRSGGVWTQQEELAASDGATWNAFGSSVSVSGDTVVIGAYGHNVNQGASYVFVLSGGAWAQQQELIASDGAGGTLSQNGLPEGGDQFGYSVSVSGDTVVIGAWHKTISSQYERGAAYVFVSNGGVWSQQQELTASDGAAWNTFGNSVSVSGGTVVIGAEEETPYPGTYEGTGRAYVFTLSSAVWGQQQELAASDGAANDNFGGSVSVSGDTAVIGANGHNLNQGAAYVFVGGQPAISGVISAGAFGGFSAAAPGTWVEIYGSNLASSTQTWTPADFAGNYAPSSLGDVQVTVGGQPAFIDYISPSQVNAQLPSGIGPGSLQLIVTSAGVPTGPVNVTVNATEPGLLAPPSFKIGANQYVVAQFGDGTYALPTGAIAGVSSRPAKPGETIVIYGIGFGPVVPSIPAGQTATGTTELSASLQFLFAQTPAQGAPYAGLAPGYVGLYQFNIEVPQVPDNDLVPLTFTLGGVPGTQALYTAVHQ